MWVIGELFYVSRGSWVGNLVVRSGCKVSQRSADMFALTRNIPRYHNVTGSVCKLMLMYVNYANDMQKWTSLKLKMLC